MLLIGVAIALVGALGLPLGIDFFSPKIRTPDDVRRILNVPLLASLRANRRRSAKST